MALTTAGTYLRKSTLSFEQYLHEYEKRWNVNPRRPLKLHEYRDRTLYNTWDLSYARLKNDDLDAARLLELLAYFDNQHIWHDLLRAGISDRSPEWLLNVAVDPLDFENAMGTLVDYCFVEVHSSTLTYSMHACVHDWTFGDSTRSSTPKAIGMPLTASRTRSTRKTGISLDTFGMLI